jgi:hypothetical protein
MSLGIVLVCHDYLSTNTKVLYFLRREKYRTSFSVGFRKGEQLSNIQGGSFFIKISVEVFKKPVAAYNPV